MPSIALKAWLYQIFRTVCLMHILNRPQLHNGLYQDGEQDLGVTIPICDFLRSPSALILLKLPSQEDLGILSPRAAFKALLYPKRDKDAHKMQAVRNSIVTFNLLSGKEEENILQKGRHLRNDHLKLFTTVLTTSKFHFRLIPEGHSTPGNKSSPSLFQGWIFSHTLQ